MSLENLPAGACIDPALHPELTERKRFVRIEHDGASCICRPNEVDDMIDDGDPGQYKITDAWMTEKEFDTLPEFVGF